MIDLPQKTADVAQTPPVLAPRLAPQIHASPTAVRIVERVGEDPSDPGALSAAGAVTPDDCPAGKLDASAAFDALTAVREALDIPHAATLGDQEVRAGILHERLRHVLVMLKAIFGGGPADVPWQITHLRERLAEHPATGYATWDARVAEPGDAKVQALPAHDAVEVAL